MQLLKCLLLFARLLCVKLLADLSTLLLILYLSLHERIHFVCNSLAAVGHN
jgi:hypothetical protein